MVVRMSFKARYYHLFFGFKFQGFTSLIFVFAKMVLYPPTVLPHNLETPLVGSGQHCSGQGLTPWCIGSLAASKDPAGQMSGGRWRRIGPGPGQAQININSNI